MKFVGVDLAWGEGSAMKPANETGLCVIDADGRVLDAGWARGIPAVADWILAAIEPDARVPDIREPDTRVPSTDDTHEDTHDTTHDTTHEGAVIAVDAPLVVPNATGMRESEKQVGRAYGRWKVACNPTNQALGWLGGVTLRDRLEGAGVVVTDGLVHPPLDARVMFECYPYTTLVGMAELGYDDERPRYKRLDRSLPPAEARVARQAATDELIRRAARLDAADPPLDLRSHPVTRALVDEPTPLAGPAHKHREDLLDAALCAWTASIWARHGDARTQVLGRDEARDARGRPATIVTPARPAQRLPRPA
ncbi:DUF429 domain-containing protein [Frondihabitans cladoniiphilus]|uniref:DUF429 domain-containing protein n=1 Tax=Frondihabitans cladoniiphilus TaxID=715785 RepID=A0ABP8W437_9MICO